MTTTAEKLEYRHPIEGTRIPLVAVYHPSYVLAPGPRGTQQEALQDLQEAPSPQEG